MSNFKTLTLLFQKESETQNHTLNKPKSIKTCKYQQVIQSYFVCILLSYAFPLSYFVNCELELCVIVRSR